MFLARKVIRDARNLVPAPQVAPLLGQQRAVLPQVIVVEASHRKVDELALLPAEEHVAAAVAAEPAVVVWLRLIGAQRRIGVPCNVDLLELMEAEHERASHLAAP